jgi:hypothetical protein
MGIESYIKGNRITNDAIVDLEKVAEFQAKHDEHISKNNKRLRDKKNYKFTYIPSGIGTAIIVTCGCGEEADLTDYSCW